MINIKEKNSERGAALVELALVLPFLLLLLVGIIELGLLFYNQQVLTNSSREGARVAISLNGQRLIDKGIANVADFNAEVNSIVQTYCQNHFITFNTDQAPVTVVGGALSTYPAELTVTVNYTYTFLIPELLKLGPSLPLSASTVMNMEMTLN